MVHLIKILKFSNKYPYSKILEHGQVCVYLSICICHIKHGSEICLNTKLVILSKCSLLYHNCPSHFYSHIISNQYDLISKLTIMYQPVPFIGTLYFFLAWTTLRNEKLWISFLNSTSIYISKNIFVIIQYIKTVSGRYSV